MSQNETMLTAIDVGTTKVCTIVAKRNGGSRPEVLAHSTVPSRGLRKGNVVDISATQKAIRASLDAVEQETGLSVGAAYIGVTGAHVSFENRLDPLDSNGVITAADVAMVPGKVSSAESKSGRQVIHAIPMAFSLDGKSGIRNPVGMHSDHVEVETHVVTGSPSIIDNLIAAVERSGIAVDGLVLEPLASGEAVLTPEERENGAAVVDIGGGTTDIVVFKNDRICYSAVIPVAGHQFTNDIVVSFNTTYEAAEEAKLKFASAEPMGIDDDEELTLPPSGRGPDLKVRRNDLCQVIRERAQELASLVKIRLDEATMVDRSNIRIVLTGGASNLPGLDEVMKRTVGRKLRRGIPTRPATVPQQLKNPAYATGVGIILWAANEINGAGSIRIGTNGSNGRNGHSSRVRSGGPGTMSRLWSQLRKFSVLGMFSPQKGGSNGHQ